MKLKSNKYSNRNQNLSVLFYKIFKRNLKHIAKVDKDQKCSNCKSSKKIFFYAKCNPDFNANVLMPELFKKFYCRAIGQCTECGLIQEFNYFTPSQLESYEKILTSKDMAVSEEIWHKFPIPDDAKKYDFDKFFKKRFLKWDKELKLEKNIENILFLRPSFGTIMKYFENFKNANFYFLDISEIAKKTVIQDFPRAKELKGNIHAIYRGEFLKYKNNFDLIVSNHHILHCFDLNHTFNQLKKLIKDNGKIIFMNEITIKYWNPFHIFFWDEPMFFKILKKNFKNIQIIRNCGPDESDIKEFKFISDHTKYRDNPDFVVSLPISNNND